MPLVEPLFMCVQRGELKFLIELLSKDPASVNATDETGQTVLHCACAQGQIDIVIFLLNRCDCKIGQQDYLYGHTPLHVACLYDQQKVVLELLKKMESSPKLVNQPDNFGWTALHHAARNGNVEICKLLLNHGGCADIANGLGKTPCHYAAQHGHLPVLRNMFDYVESTLSPPVVALDVLSVPTLLHCAALRNSQDVVEWLKQKSISPTSKCRRVIDYDRNISRDEFAEDVAASKGYPALRGVLSQYRVMYEEWIQDIAKDKVTLDRIKLCICGHPRVGKSAMRQSLSRPYLQTLLGRDVAETPEGDVDRSTFGIEITSMQLSGKDLFSVWDFAGQVESFITHQFFISTQNTVFTVLVDLTKSVEEQRAQLMFWLGFIKMRNLGQVPFSPGPRGIEKDIVPMPCGRQDVYRLLPMRSWTRKSFRPGHDLQQVEEENDMYGSVLQPVPVVIVGSHYDVVSSHSQQETVHAAQLLVNEMKERFEEYLDISPTLYPLNCLKAVSPEIKVLKDCLCEVRAKLLEVQPQYPRVIEVVARKIESLRVEQPRTKVLFWDNVKKLVREEVNRLLSEKQLSYIFRCLANAGVLVYFDQGALANYVFIDPGWLCQDVLGKALAPGSFPVSRIASVGSAQISEQTLEAKFAQHIDKHHIPIIIALLQHFELCHRRKDNGFFEFPCFVSEFLSPDMWKEEERFVAYTGRRLVCSDETDSFPPGFFSRLQVQVSAFFRQEKLLIFNGSFLVDGEAYQCLIKINSRSTAIELIGRTGQGLSQNCLQLMDQIQTMIAALIRDVCPTIFLEHEILSSSDLKRHLSDPHCYTINEVVAAEFANRTVFNQQTGVEEHPTDLLYLSDTAYHEAHKDSSRKVAYIPEEIIDKIQELLRDGEKDWRVLAKAINLEQYIQLLESRSPESTRLLLLKWAEKPRWTVHSLLYALKDIERIDVYNFVRAHLTKKK